MRVRSTDTVFTFTSNASPVRIDICATHGRGLDPAFADKLRVAAHVAHIDAHGAGWQLIAQIRPPREVENFNTDDALAASLVESQPLLIFIDFARRGGLYVQES